MKKLRDVLSDKSKWTQRAMARDADDVSVAVNSKEACKFCLVGALDKLDIPTKEYDLKREKIMGYIKNFPAADILYASPTFPTFGDEPVVYSLSRFNDFNSWETIDTMLNKLDI